MLFGHFLATFHHPPSCFPKAFRHSSAAFSSAQQLSNSIYEHFLAALGKKRQCLSIFLEATFLNFMNIKNRNANRKIFKILTKIYPMALLLDSLNLVRQFLSTFTKWLKFAEDLYETSILERLELLSPGDGSFYIYVQYIVLYLRSHIQYAHSQLHHSLSCS